jgi:hypothetical protein
MGKILKIIFFLISVLLFVYILPKSPEFPKELPNSVQSFEPADVEDPFRRGYYTNLTREEIIAYYIQEFNKSRSLYTLRLNYPPEEAQTIIRDQTKSTFLEELVHPLRESLYINGFESEGTIYEFKINEVIWQQKVIVRYVPSSIFIRIVVSMLTLVSIYILVREYKNV